MGHSIILLNALPDKKIKSIGNKCLIPVGNKINLLDYHIATINKIYKNPEIVVVCGFDTKKIKKYIEDKHRNIIYIDHEITEYTNIGQSILTALSVVSNKNCLIINANNILHKKAIDQVVKYKGQSFVLTKKNSGDIGYISDTSKIINCYYGLPHSVCEVLYINENDFDKFSTIKHHDISKMYMFEIINHCINLDIKIKPVVVAETSVTSLENLQNIKKLTKLCRI
jgi:hypothetical protein